MSMDEDLENMSRDALVAEAKRLRAGVRAHRDSSGHDLCWHHPQLWGLLPERTDPDVAVPSWPKFLRGCVAYREALDRELSGAPVADVDYDAMEHIRTPGLEAFEGRWHFSHVVAARGLLLLSGVTATGVDGMVSSVPAEQFEQAFVHLRLYLEAAEASLEDVVEMTSYHVDLRQHLDAFMAAKDRHIAAPYPAWSAIGVSQLITEGALVEIRAIAVDPRSSG
jgi:enamine deaminase RidA (YjgF/YER057c/UK114 family)